MAQFDYQSLIAGLSEDGFDSAEFVRQLVERGYQELIDAGAAVHIGAERHERTSTRKNRRNGSAGAPWPPGPATSRSPSRSCARAATTPSSWSAEGASTRPSTGW